MYLFLDFDGVLHPDDVYAGSSGPILRNHGELFMWASMLDQELAPYRHVKIVLSTSWVRHLDFARAKKRLPQGLRARVIGSTWHSSMAQEWKDEVWWDKSSRYQQIARYVARASIAEWIAIDDDANNWGEHDLDRLLLTDAKLGLTTVGIMEKLKHELSRTHQPPVSKS